VRHDREKNVISIDERPPVQFATLRSPDGTRAAVVVDDSWRALPAADLSALLEDTSLEAAIGSAGDEVADVDFALPLTAPRKVICCGLNYGEHIREMGRDLPAHPTLFAKHADALVGPTDDIVMPSGIQLDWEAELAVVVGSPLRNVDRAAALAGIAGYTVANDVSVRDWQNRTLQWFQGKAWDASTPVGPVIVTPDELDPRDGVDVVCRVNGEEVQRDSTSTLVFDPADLLSYISTFTVLRPGDLVLTGTPGGVGAGRVPPRFLCDGDVLETEVAGIGTLRNTIHLDG
jgi:acylpyruvate hydrolase